MTRSLPALVPIPAGTFQMGSNAAGGAPYFGSSAEKPVHQITISKPFWMGQYEVTQAEYEALMGTNPSHFRGDDRPVDSVSWHDAMAYTKALNAQQTALGNVPPGYQFRLPTEAEWEYACRAGTTTEYACGDTLSHSAARFDSRGGTVWVGSFPPNPWGLHDMHGNVWEWCLDTYGPYQARIATNPFVTDPFVTGGRLRVLRGGSWSSLSDACRSAYRFNVIPGFTSKYGGLRVVLAPVLVP